MLVVTRVRAAGWCHGAPTGITFATGRSSWCQLRLGGPHARPLPVGRPSRSALCCSSPRPQPPRRSPPVRFWSVSRIDQGEGEVPVDSGAQVGGTLQKTAGLGRLVFNLPLHTPYWSLPAARRRVRRAVLERHGHAVLRDGSGAAAQSPPGGRAEGRPHAPRRVPGLREALRRRLAEDHAVGPAAADDRRQQQPRRMGVPAGRHLRPGADRRALPRPRVRRVGGRRLLRHRRRRVSGRASALVAARCGDVGGLPEAAVGREPVRRGRRRRRQRHGRGRRDGAQGPQARQGPARRPAPRRAVRRARQPRGRGGRRSRRRVGRAVVHPGSAEARTAAADDARSQGARQAALQGAPPQGAAAARCPGGRPRHAGVLRFSDAGFSANESEASPMVLVSRTGGSHGSAERDADHALRDRARRP